ncbi:MAG: ABC transporter ATP-binding protein [Cellulosilyticaceae bacterium]
MANVIEFKDFSFRYDNLKKPTLRNIQLEIGQGEKVLIAGPSGSGKSTLAHCINGLIPFAYEGHIEGSLKVLGEETKGKNLYQMSKCVGTILQDSDGQFVALSVGEDVAFAFENDCVPKEEMISRVDKILDVLGMESFKQHSPENISGGQKQKVAMAGVLAMESPILLFDEPLANLDPMSGQLAMDTIDALHKDSDKTIIVVEHRIEDVLAHDFNRVVLIDQGEIVFNGTPDEVLRAGILGNYGLREPLYVEALRSFGIDVSKEMQLTDMQTLTKYKEVLEAKLEEVHLQAPQAHTEKPLLEVRDLRYRYSKDDRWILDDINFDIYEGEFLAILGNNGAGKSTLLKALTGFCKIEEGNLKFQGKDITKESIKARASKIGYVMQNPNHMITKYMIFDEIAFGLRNFGMKEEEVTKRVEEVLDICNLKKYRKWPVTSLSYGQKKRVTIASILALRPKVIVLDEPTAGQDHRNYTEFMGFLNTLKKQGVTVVMITHDMQLALEYADRGVVVSSGKVLMEGSIFEVLSNEEVLNQANLKATSVADLGKAMGDANIQQFLEKVMTRQREVLAHA